MREYKFRGKRINSDEWIYGYGVVIGEHYGRMHGEEREASIFVEYDNVAKLNYQLVEVDPETVGQYTGLKDKNGNEIYEGDIVKGYWWKRGESHRHIGIVNYVMNAFKVRGVKQYLGIDDELSPTYEVIGNRFDNPELLEEVRE